MEESYTVTEVVTEGSRTAQDWVQPGITLDVLRRWDSSTEGEMMSVTDGNSMATCHFDDEGRLVFGGSYSYFNRRVEVE